MQARVVVGGIVEEREGTVGYSIYNMIQEQELLMGRVGIWDA